MIYGIGLPKTGTTSLIEALKILGYEQYKDFHVGDYVYWMDKSDGDKFILTYRNGNKWYKSVCKWSLRRDKLTPKILIQRKKMYGRFLPHFSKIHFLRKYTTHNFQMIKTFHPLILNIESGEGWEELCEYLNKPIPNVPFPHLNKQR